MEKNNDDETFHRFAAFLGKAASQVLQPIYPTWLIVELRADQEQKNRADNARLIVLFFVVILATEGLVGLEMLLSGWGWVACISSGPVILFPLLMGDRFWTEQ